MLKFPLFFLWMMTWVWLTLCLSPPPLLAQESEVLRDLVETSDQAMNQGEFEVARRANMRGYELTADPIWLHNASVCLWEAGRPQEALAMGKQVRAQASTRGDTVLYQTSLDYAQRWQTILQARTLARHTTTHAAALGISSPAPAATSVQMGERVEGAQAGSGVWKPWVLVGLGGALGVSALAVSVGMDEERERFDALKDRTSGDPEAYEELESLHQSLINRRNLGLGLGFAACLAAGAGVAWRVWGDFGLDSVSWRFGGSAEGTQVGIRATF